MSNNPLPSIFRKVALDAHRAAPLGSVLLARPTSSAYYVWFAVLFVTALVSFVSLASYTRRTTIVGSLQIDGGVTRLRAQVNGIVQEKFVDEGQAVTAGQALFVVSTETTSEKYGETHASIIQHLAEKEATIGKDISRQKAIGKHESERLQSDIQSLEKELVQYTRQLAAQADQLRLVEYARKRQQSLVDDGFISPDAAKQKEIEVAEQRGRVASLEREVLILQRTIKGKRVDAQLLPDKQMREIEALEKSRSDVQVSLREQEANRRVTVTAPRDGTTTALSGYVGQQVSSETVLGSVIPVRSSFRGVLYASSKQMGLLQIGNQLRVSHQAYPYQRFGLADGSVIGISEVPVTADEISKFSPGGELQLNTVDGPFYMVTISLKKLEDPSAATSISYRTGMLLEAQVEVEKKRLYQWIFQPAFELLSKAS